jgi:exodeoxyribonuclease VII large subunit
MEHIELSPSDFVALLNQTLDYAYPSVTVVGEVANFRVSRGKWVYFDLKDDYASVKFFGTVYSLPGPIEDGMRLSVVGRPHLHDLYGFSVQVVSITPVGAGTIKKAADLLAAKLQAEGLFDSDRKRSIPYPPKKIGLITSLQSAAYADFIKVISARYSGLEINVYDAQVQGEQAVIDIVNALKYFGEQAELCDVVVVTRGGGSADDLAAFSHEHVVRAVASSRVPTLIAIGHEVDLSLAELAADARASTPSNAAELLVPDKKDVLLQLDAKADRMRTLLLHQLEFQKTLLKHQEQVLHTSVASHYKSQLELLKSQARLLEVLSPQAALTRGYALVRSNGHSITSASPQNQFSSKYPGSQTIWKPV